MLVAAGKKISKEEQDSRLTPCSQGRHHLEYWAAGQLGLLAFNRQRQTVCCGVNFHVLLVSA
jgi:hypothetical protein